MGEILYYIVEIQLVFWVKKWEKLLVITLRENLMNK